MRKSTFLGLALASALTIGSFSAFAQPGFGGPGGWHGHHHGDFGGFQQLNLSDAQKASIKQIVKGSFQQNKSQFQALHQQREAFEALSPTSSGYQAAANSLAQAEASAAQARTLQRASIRAQIYAVLTPAQQSQLATLKAQRAQQKQQWEQFRAQQKAASTTQQSSGQ